MMRYDCFGQTATLESNTALAAWNETMMGFLAHGASTPNTLGTALLEDPRFALGHAVKGLFVLLLGRRELFGVASQALSDARREAGLGSVTLREARYIEALGHWLDGFPSRSVNSLEAVLSDNPEDALAAKLSHAIRFVLGDSAGMRQSIERVLPACGPDHPAHGYLRGCYAFALEETGDYRFAESEGRAGLEHRPDDAWGLHAVAHVYDMTARARDGLEWLDLNSGAWGHCNNFRLHVWWHRALMHLDLGEFDQALALYDNEIRAERTDDYRDISNAASLLSRLELDGIEVGQRWEELADLSARRTEDGCLIFADLHYLLALIGDGRDTAVSVMMARLERDARRGRDEIGRRMARPGMDAALGLEAFGEGDFHTAFRCLERARTNLIDAGGSHAQRDVFERLMIDSGIRSGHLDEASRLLSNRTAKRGGYDDGYARARREMIADARRIPAE